MSPRVTLIWAGLMLLLVTSCTQMPARTASPWVAPNWTEWTLQGRIAVRAGDEGWHASLIWHQTGNAYQADLSGPLGQGALRLQGDDTGVRLQRADGLRDQSADADALLARHTGWRLPVNGLRYWVLGLAAPQSGWGSLPGSLPGSTPREARWERDANGRPERLLQDGWDIRYTAFQEWPGLGTLPRRIEMEREGLHARLLIDTWTPHAPD